MKKMISIILIGLGLLGCGSHPQTSAYDSREKIVFMWQLNKDITDEDLIFLITRGVNTVQSFSLITWEDKDIETFLNRMSLYGFKVIVSLVSLPYKNNEEWVFDEITAKTFINKWKDYPAVFAWHLFDEPSNGTREIPIEFQRKFYEFVKTLDPEHYVFLSWNGTSERHYKYFFSKDTFDILDIHAYINDDINERQINLMESFSKIYDGSYPVIITIRAFNSPVRVNLPPDGLQEQYDFFFKRYNITNNIGFYGWHLSKNYGINDDSDIMLQYNNFATN